VAGVDHHQISTHVGSRRFVLCLALVSAHLVTTQRGEAAELAGAELAVEHSQTATDCPTAGALATATLALGSPPKVRTGSLTLVVRFDHDLEGYVAHIEAAGRKQGNRELRTAGATCRSLADAVAVVLAVLSDLTPSAAPSEAPPRVAEPAPLLPPPAAATPPAPTPTATLALTAESGLAYGLLGNVATGTASVALRGRYRALSLDVGGFWSTPHFEQVAPGILELGLLGGATLACGWLGSDAHFDLSGCTGLGVGSLGGSGHGFDTDDEANVLWLSWLAGFTARLPFNSRWAAGFSLLAVVPLRSQSFRVTRVAGGFSSEPAAVLLRFGPEYRFW
jgi:hypothetical protein